MRISFTPNPGAPWFTHPIAEEGAEIIKKYASWITDERKMELAKTGCDLHAPAAR